MSQQPPYQPPPQYPQQPPPGYPPQQPPPGYPPPGGGGPSSANMDPKLEGLLCYLLTWVGGLVFLFVEKQNQEVRFHAWQSIALFGGYTIVYIVLSTLGAFMPGAIRVFLGFVLDIGNLGLLVLWIVLMVQTYQGKKMVLPVVGPFAEQQVASGTLM